MNEIRIGAFRLRWGDVAVSIVGAVLTVLYISLAVENPTAILVLQAVLSFCFIPALAMWRTQVVPAAIVLLVLLCFWCATFIAALPANTGVPPYLLAAPMAIYSLTRHGEERRIAWAVLLVCAVAAPASPLMWEVHGVDDLQYRSGGTLVGFLVLHWALLAVAFLWALHRRSEQQRREREHEVARERERILIAQEIHDVLAHNLTLINVQSSAGIIGARTDPHAAVTALSTIRTVSGEALAQVRGIVAALRSPSPVRPAESASTLAEILENFRGLGLTIKDDYPADILHRVPAQHALALRRITTESLTNVLRHQQSGSAVEYRLVENTSELVLSVESIGVKHPDSKGSGTGVMGMRERALALGGVLRSEPTEHGWCVIARLPLGEHQRGEH